MSKALSYKEKQREKGIRLIREGFFEGDTGGGKYKGIPRPFVLKDGIKNIFPGIRTDNLNYFNANKISWWGGHFSTGHVLSSQIACLNHLFPLRYDREAVLNLLKTVSDEFTEVFIIKENIPGYIQFEAVGSDDNLINEETNTRGRNCTSVDALIYALHKNKKRFLIPIEWKYAESYGNENKSIDKEGETRKGRYLQLIEKSNFLNENTLSCCWYEPFYQLMRQTLLTEQIIQKKINGLEAEDYLHIHVIPDENHELLDKIYPCSQKGMSQTWKNCLTNPDKYVVISPTQLWSKQNRNADIFKYLDKRYWQHL
jgi:hypothetical protein